MWMEDDRKVNRYSAVINWNEGRGCGGGGGRVRELRVGEGGELAFILLFPFLVSICTCYYFFKNSLRGFFLNLFFYISVSISSSLSLSLCPFLSIYFIYLCYLSIFLSFSCMPPYLTIISHFSLFLPHSFALSSIFSIRHYSVSLLWVLIVLSRISALSFVRNFPRTLIKENLFLKKKKKKLLPSD